MSEITGTQAHNGTLKKQNIMVCTGVYRQFDKVVKLYINSHLSVHTCWCDVCVLFSDYFLPYKRHFSKFWCSGYFTFDESCCEPELPVVRQKFVCSWYLSIILRKWVVHELIVIVDRSRHRNVIKLPKQTFLLKEALNAISLALNLPREPNTKRTILVPKLSLLPRERGWKRASSHAGTV